MIRLLSIITLVLTIVLFPPAALALISNNAVEGDVTYPIKRKLEDVIYAVASLNPTSQAWFSAARSDRRFKEINALVGQGKQAGNTLNELVEQTSVAAVQIAQIEDPVQKQQLITSYTQTIEKYNLGLTQLAQTNPAPQIALQPSQQPQSAPQFTTPPTTSTSSVPSPTPSITPKATSIPAKVSATPYPSVRPTQIPTVVPTPISSPTIIPSQPTTGESNKQEIEDAIAKLEKIKEKLKNEKQNNSDLTPKMDTSKIEKKGNEGVPTPEPDAMSTPAGSVKTKNEK